MENGLGAYFESYLEKQSLFMNKTALQTNYIPENIFYREDQLKQIASILAPCLRNQKVSNLFIYGKPGTGKTLTMKHVAQNMEEVAKKRKLLLKIIYVNCKLKKVADTEYRLIAHLAREFGKAIPPTGLPTDEVYSIFFRELDKEEKNILIILDEVDVLVGKIGDEMLYNLTRINAELKNAKVSIVGISNDIIFTEGLDPRVKSSLSEEEIVYSPYNAEQLQKILFQRVTSSFQHGVVKEGVVEKCAALAAREHGDARRAIELLRVAGELAEREGSDFVDISHLDKAEEKVEKDKVLELVKNQPKHYQATLYSIFELGTKKNAALFTGEVYEYYKKVCERVALRPLTQRRVSDIIGEFDILGVVNAKVVSKGRFGRTREIFPSTSFSLLGSVKEVLCEGLGL
ncbi:orc1/cdc6 family replication initiation protein [Candidatus Woesearchaeota archaeon]|nr:orc1/cdc6 family replication initiation protein [Candidatus Woesearchaeota archaeon]